MNVKISTTKELQHAKDIQADNKGKDDSNINNNNDGQ